MRARAVPQRLELEVLGSLREQALGPARKVPGDAQHAVQRTEGSRCSTFGRSPQR
jgi:hypothetical protein